MSARPDRISIFPDEYHLPHVGKTSAGLQAWLTEPFVPTMGSDEGCEYVALYLFDGAGKLTSHTIKSLGPRAALDKGEAKRVHAELLESVSPLLPEGIVVEPFSVEHEGIEFGLIPREPEDEDEDWTVEAQPGNYLSFYAPWDEGEYDT